MNIYISFRYLSGVFHKYVANNSKYSNEGRLHQCFRWH